ncbi:MAG: hypothetical protein [Caudoviricetes sp.]|nr:MAG: hypothetical protein [Caudoviricetes sp.]
MLINKLEKLDHDNRMYSKFHSDDFRDFPGYHQLRKDIIDGKCIEPSNYPNEARRWLHDNMD